MRDINYVLRYFPHPPVIIRGINENDALLRYQCCTPDFRLKHLKGEYTISKVDEAGGPLWQY